jgi:ElaB/YqjD/DUF883 family membrane-anchored ribosome-binding protein
MARDALTKSADELRGDIDQLRDDVAALMRSVSKLAGNGQRAGIDRLMEAGSLMRDQVREAGGRARDVALEQVEAAEEKIVQNPFASVLVAFGTGLLLGKVFGRR